jgi:hypothetical protein
MLEQDHEFKLQETIINIDKPTFRLKNLKIEGETVSILFYSWRLFCHVTSQQIILFDFVQISALEFEFR